MVQYGSGFWKRTPFLRLLLSLAAGIIIQWHLQWNLLPWLAVAGSASFFLMLVSFSDLFNRYKFSAFAGIAACLLFCCAGALLARQHDVRNNKKWLGNFYEKETAVVAVLDEPPVEKTKSFKANATVSYILQQEKVIPVKGKIIIYFQKDSAFNLAYGSTIIFKKPLQEIKNSGNPGGFDYKRYCLFQGITHQIYLRNEDAEVLPEQTKNKFRSFIYSTRQQVLNILRKNIKGDKELGLAEALLIGYKDDLEQSLVQSYTNTGVVHIIAISGLHLGLIYWLLAWILRPLQKQKKTKWLRPVLIITGLWLFSLLAGAQPSILRSAIMFTCIVLGESLSRRTSIYNTMAVSAFILLCINPYWLWDVGFQLSYAAVLSIIIFMRPVYNWFYIKNKLLDFIWKLNAVTIAAQILTIPVGIYHFHQFPNLFLFTNFLAVPLSSVILLGEIALCVFSFIPAVAGILGKIISSFIWLMNTYIERIESIPFSLWDGLQISLPQAVLLLLFAAGISYWLMEKSVTGLKWGAAVLLFFIAMRSYSFIMAERQQKIVVYNVPRKTAIDFISGRQYFFEGDSDLLADDFARNFHLKPSRVLYRIENTAALQNLVKDDNYFLFRGKRVLLIDKTCSFDKEETKPLVDLLIISKNPALYMNNLAESLTIKQVVFDGSVPAWKADYWKKDCDSLHIPWYDVTTKGAFIMPL